MKQQDKNLILWVLILLGIFLYSFSLDAHAARYNARQVSVLQAARGIGELYGFPETLQGIVLQESSAGLQKLGDDGKSLGLAHVTLPAALDVLRACSTVKYKQACGWLPQYIGDQVDISIRLATDDQFNLLVAALYHKIQYQYFKEHHYSNPWGRSVIAYNAGRNYAKSLTVTEIYSNKYHRMIKYRIKNIRKFNAKHKVWI